MVRKPSLDSLLGAVIAHTWFGDYSFLYLELGELTPSRRRDGTAGNNPVGEIAVYAGFSWRVERPRSILGGSGSPRKRWPVLAKGLEGATVVSADLTGRIPELSVGLSNGLTLVTFTAYNGQPEWTISFNKLRLGNLCVRKGRVSLEQMTDVNTTWCPTHRIR
jgi:hypothetical protein